MPPDTPFSLLTELLTRLDARSRDAMDSACSVILMGNLPAGATRCELFHHFSGRFSSRHRHSEARRHSRNGKRAGHQETTSGNDLCLLFGCLGKQPDLPKWRQRSFCPLVKNRTPAANARGGCPPVRGVRPAPCGREIHAGVLRNHAKQTARAPPLAGGSSQASLPGLNPKESAVGHQPESPAGKRPGSSDNAPGGAVGHQPETPAGEGVC